MSPRSYPPILMRGQLSGAVFIVTRYIRKNDGTIEATERYDVSTYFFAIARQLEAEKWVNERWVAIENAAKAVDREYYEGDPPTPTTLRALHAALQMSPVEGSA